MFPVTLTLTLHNEAQLAQVQRLFAGAAVTAEEKAAVLSGSNDKAEIVKQAPGKPSAAKTAPSQPTAEAAQSKPDPSDAASATPTTNTLPAADASFTTPAFEYATLQKAVNAAVPKHGKDKLLAIAAKHGAPTFKLLTEDKFEAAYDDVVALG